MGDILSVTEGIILHGCNMQGKMGAGLAKQIADKYPKVLEKYKKALPYSRLGSVIYVSINPNLIIANALIQDRYGRDPNITYCDYKAIEQAFKLASQRALFANMPLHYSKIGAGFANGDWKIISEIIEEGKLKNVEYIYWGD